MNIKQKVIANEFRYFLKSNFVGVNRWFENVLILPSKVTGCVSISAFALLVCLPVGIRSSVEGINICAITAGMKKYKSIIKKKKKKHDKIELWGKDKINTIEVLIFKSLIDSYISHDHFFVSKQCFTRIQWDKKKKKILKLLWNIKIILYKNVDINRKNVWKKWYRNNSK